MDNLHDLSECFVRLRNKKRPEDTEELFKKLRL